MILVPLVLAELVKFATENGLGVTVSATAIVLAILAFHGRHVLGFMARVQTATYSLMAFLLLLAVGLATGVIEGLDIGALLDLAGTAWGAITGLLGGGA